MFVMLLGLSSNMTQSDSPWWMDAAKNKIRMTSSKRHLRWLGMRAQVAELCSDNLIALSFAHPALDADS